MSNPELEKDEYDVVVLGTGLGESITAAALAKAGKSVLHLDTNDYYGAAQASITLDELVSWSNRQNGASSSPSSSSSSYTHASYTPITPSLEKDQRRYALSLFPAVLPSRGDLIDVLVESDVSKYVSFRMLDSTSIHHQDKLRRVPGSKEEVFKDKSITLMEKRKIMKFLMFAAGEYESDPLYIGKEDVGIRQFLQGSFGLSLDLADAVGFAIAHCSSVEDKTGAALARTRRYLRSVGRYGSGAFLVGQYGGAGEVAQGFCRACAVFGGTYVLGSSAIPSSIAVEETIRLEIPCHPRPITAKHLVTASPSHLPDILRSKQRRSTSEARCIAILDELPSLLCQPTEQDEETKEQDDTAIIVFPPEDGRQSVVRALVMGEGTGSCPAGQFVIYLSTESGSDHDPKATLQPFLRRLSSIALFESYHLVHHYQVEKSTSDSVVLLSSYLGLDSLTEGLDWEAEQGRKAYSAVMGTEEEEKEFFEKAAQDEEEADEL